MKNIYLLLATSLFFIDSIEAATTSSEVNWDEEAIRAGFVTTVTPAKFKSTSALAPYDPEMYESLQAWATIISDMAGGFSVSSPAASTPAHAEGSPAPTIGKLLMSLLASDKEEAARGILASYGVTVGDTGANLTSVDPDFLPVLQTELEALDLRAAPASSAAPVAAPSDDLMPLIMSALESTWDKNRAGTLRAFRKYGMKDGNDPAVALLSLAPRQHPDLLTDLTALVEAPDDAPVIPEEMGMGGGGGGPTSVPTGVPMGMSVPPWAFDPSDVAVAYPAAAPAAIPSLPVAQKLSAAEKPHLHKLQQEIVELHRTLETGGGEDVHDMNRKALTAMSRFLKPLANRMTSIPGAVMDFGSIRAYIKSLQIGDTITRLDNDGTTISLRVSNITAILDRSTDAYSSSETPFTSRQALLYTWNLAQWCDAIRNDSGSRMAFLHSLHQNIDTAGGCAAGVEGRCIPLMVQNLYWLSTHGKI